MINIGKIGVLQKRKKCVLDDPIDCFMVVNVLYLSKKHYQNYLKDAH